MSTSKNEGASAEQRDEITDTTQRQADLDTSSEKDDDHTISTRRTTAEQDLALFSNLKTPFSFTIPVNESVTEELVTKSSDDCVSHSDIGLAIAYDSDYEHTLRSVASVRSRKLHQENERTSAHSIQQVANRSTLSLEQTSDDIGKCTGETVYSNQQQDSMALISVSNNIHQDLEGSDVMNVQCQPSTRSSSTKTHDKKHKSIIAQVFRIFRPRPRYRPSAYVIRELEQDLAEARVHTKKIMLESQETITHLQHEVDILSQKLTRSKNLNVIDRERYDQEYASLLQNYKIIQRKLCQRINQMSKLEERRGRGSRNTSPTTDPFVNGLKEIFQERLVQWSETYFKTPILETERYMLEDTRESNLLNSLLGEVTFDPTNALKHSLMTTPLFVQAIVSEMLTEHIFNCPFVNCDLEDQKLFNRIYEASKEADLGLACRWRAATITMLEMEILDIKNSVEQVLKVPKLQSRRARFYRSLTANIDALLDPVARPTSQNSRIDNSKPRIRELLEIVKLCGDLAVDQSKEPIEYRFINKNYMMQKRGRNCYYDAEDGQVKNEDKTQTIDTDVYRTKVETVVGPGIAKVESDVLGNMTTTVILPAKVLLTESRERSTQTPCETGSTTFLD